MAGYVLVTDATVDLPQSVIEQYGIHVIPMAFDLDGKDYFHYADCREMPRSVFYDKLKQGSVSHSSQITPQMFKDNFKPILESGKDIIYIGFSSGLSNTWQNAFLTIQDLQEKYPDRKIIGIDSLSASVGEAVLVLNAAQRMAGGMELEELAAWVKCHRHAARHWFTVQDLFYLKRGGRLSTAEALVGTALKIRPVLSVDREGKLIVCAKVRGEKKAMDFLMGKLREEGVSLSEQTAVIGHSANPGQAEALQKMLEAEGLVKDSIISEIGPIIGTHVGPGFLALTFIGEEDRD